MGELIAIFTGEHDATLENTTSPIVGPRGEIQVRYLRREADGEVKASEPLLNDDDDLVGWDMARRLCRQLGLEANLVPGLHLG